MAQMIWTITGDDARGVGKDPAQYAAEVRRVLLPYNVEVDFKPDMSGPGGLMGADNPTLRRDVEQAVARVRSAGADKLAELNNDKGFQPTEDEVDQIARS